MVYILDSRFFVFRLKGLGFRDEDKCFEGFVSGSREVLRVLCLGVERF